MRLAQLARNLGVTQNQIVDYLNKQGFSPLENGNYKLSEGELNAIEEKYGVYSPQETEAPETTEQSQDTGLEPEEAPLNSADNEASIQKEEKADETGSTETDQDQQEAEKTEDEIVSEKVPEEPKEIIRAKKVKLEGIKVLGKIDLPEPPPVKEKEIQEEKESPKRQTKSRRDRTQRQHKQRKKPTYTDKVKQEEELAERERQKRKEKIKRKKKQHYLENVQPKVKPKKAKKVKPKKSAYKSAEKKTAPKYKNPLRKLWAWLNGEYDRY